MKCNIAVQNGSFQKYVFALVAGLMFCTLALHARNVGGSELRTFSIIGNPASATYLNGADGMRTVASNAVQVEVAPVARFALTTSTTSTPSTTLRQINVQSARLILLPGIPGPGSAIQSSNFNATTTDSTIIPAASFFGN